MKRIFSYKELGSPTAMGEYLCEGYGGYFRLNDEDLQTILDYIKVKNLNDVRLVFDSQTLENGKKVWEFIKINEN